MKVCKKWEKVSEHDKALIEEFRADLLSGDRTYYLTTSNGEPVKVKVIKQK